MSDKQFESISKEEMKGMLKNTNLSIKQALFNLSRIIDTGDFHTNLTNDTQQNLDLYPDIPRCFKLPLKEFENPTLILIKYHLPSLVVEKPKKEEDEEFKGEG